MNSHRDACRYPGGGTGDVTRGGWLLIFAGGLLIFAVAGGYLAWRHFCRRFVGLQETLEELHEDLVWLGEKRKPKDGG